MEPGNEFKTLFCDCENKGDDLMDTRFSYKKKLGTVPIFIKLVFEISNGKQKAEMSSHSSFEKEICQFRIP